MFYKSNYDNLSYKKMYSYTRIQVIKYKYFNYSPRSVYKKIITKTNFNKSAFKVLSFKENERDVDDYKGYQRLNISLHGGVLNHGADLEPYVVVDGQIRAYQAVVDIANEAAKVRHFDRLRLLTCHSGEGGDQSIISNVSVALRKPVKGYIGGVYALAPQRPDLETANVSKLNRSLGRALPLDEFFNEQGKCRYCRVGQDVMSGIEFFPK